MPRIQSYINFRDHEENAVFIIGDENPNDHKTYSFKTNGQKKEIKSGTFFKRIIKEGEKIKINKGGISGMSMWPKYKQGAKATFFSLSGFELGGPLPAGVIGVAFTTGH